jgi:hypothetical protein
MARKQILECNTAATTEKRRYDGKTKNGRNWSVKIVLMRKMEEERCRNMTMRMKIRFETKKERYRIYESIKITKVQK